MGKLWYSAGKFDLKRKKKPVGISNFVGLITGFNMFLLSFIY